MKIRDFYEDKVLLITGCTGFLGIQISNLILFLGKVVLEKFMRSLPNVKKIYILVRPKVSHINLSSILFLSNIK